MQHSYPFAKPFLGLACLILLFSTGEAASGGGSGSAGAGSDSPPS